MEGVCMKSCFVIGPARSGTTLMISLLDSHPELAVVPMEIKFIDLYYSKIGENKSYEDVNNFFLNKPQIKVIKENRITTIDPMSTGFLDFSNVDFNIIEKEMNINALKYENDKCRKKSLLAQYIIDFHRAYMKAMNKEPRNGFATKEGNHGLPYIRNIKENFPDAKFIIMIRDPRDSYSSRKKISGLVKSGNYYPTFGGKTHVVDFLFLINGNSLGKSCYAYMKYFQDMDSTNDFCFVQYEKLVQDPVSTMKDVAMFLGINFDEIMLKPTVAGNPWGGNASNKKQFSNISSSRIAKWQKELTMAEILLIEYFMHDYLVKWGYKQMFKKITFAKFIKYVRISDIIGKPSVSWKYFLRPNMIAVYMRNYILSFFRLIYR